VNPILSPPVPAGAYDEFLPGAAARASAQRAWSPSDGPLPALFISHGAPPLLDDGLWLRQLLDWPRHCPSPGPS
jgi:4,5-DOPA dioxygenase extradiol